MIKLLVGMATTAALVAVLGLCSTAKGREAYLQQVQPVVHQYREVLSWDD